MEEQTQSTHKNIYAALLAAKKNMGEVFKNASNPHFQSSYADLGNIVEVAEPPLQNEGILLSQPFFTEDDKPFVETILHHVESDTKIVCRVEVKCSNLLDPQKVGSALTYYRRYTLQSVLGIAPKDDDGNAASSPTPRSESRPAVKTPSQSASKPAVTTGRKIAEESTPDIPCDIPGCKNTVRAAAEKANREMHNGHAICKFHHENGDWQAAIVVKGMNIEPPADDPNFIDPESLSI